MSNSLMTHYLLPFTEIRGTAQQAACGAFVFAREHSAEPSCDKCSAYVLREAEDEAVFWADMGYVELRPGLMVPGPHAKGGPF